MSTTELVDEMIGGVQRWLQSHHYNYWECNNVPEALFTQNKKWNALLRAFFRLCPFNLRKNSDVPITPQATVALLKAFSLSPEENFEGLKSIYSRISLLRSPMVKHFSLKQGIRIATNLYEDSSDIPTPLNTVWFGQFLLSAPPELIDEHDKKDLLVDIAQYLIEELGYKDYEEKGIYFFYGHHVTAIIYNASALISSFLIKVGVKYDINHYVELGRRGILFIITNQNDDGSWFYAAPPMRSTIDNFHQSYILQALIDVEMHLDFSIRQNIDKGIAYYRTLFINAGEFVKPIRYDKRYTPLNTWLFVKVDGRDVAEAIVFFSKYVPNREMIEGLVSYLYAKFFSKQEGYFVPEVFVYGKNRVPYIEFQSWFLYALKMLRHQINSDNFIL
jgi:hypothetical protein